AVPKEQSRLVGQLKVLQSFASKLNRLLDVRHIGEVLSTELKTLIDYDSFRLHLLEGDGRTLHPIAFHGSRNEYEGQTEEGLAVAVENARLFAEERQTAETANALLRVSENLAKANDIDDVLESIVTSASELLDGVRVSAWLRGPDGSFRCQAQTSHGEEDVRR